MKIFNDLNTIKKLLGGFGLIAILLIAVALSAIWSVSQLQQNIKTVYQETVTTTERLGVVKSEISTINNDIASMINQPNERGSLETDIQKRTQTVRDQMSMYRTRKLGNAELAELAIFDKNWKSYQDAVQMAIDAIKGNNQIKAILSTANTGKAGMAKQQIIQSIDKISSLNSENAKSIYETASLTANTARSLIIIASILGVVFSILISYIITTNINRPLQLMAEISQNLSVGNLNRHISKEKLETVSTRKDEFGAVGRGMLGIEQYMKEMLGVANQIADGNLSAQLTPLSEADELCQAYIHMLSGLRDALEEIKVSAAQVTIASEQLAGNTGEAEQATSQIATTIQQVASGTAQQSASISEVANSIEQMSKAIQGVAQGAQEQASSVSEAAEKTNHITDSIKTVTKNIQTVSEESQNSSRQASHGFQVVKDTIDGMESIREIAQKSADKMEDLGKLSSQINDIVITIESIASQTNLLAVNASIEAAHAETQSFALTEYLLNRQMLAQAQLISQILIDRQTDRSQSFWTELAKLCNLDSIVVTDHDGVIIYTSNPPDLGFRFSDDPKDQSNEFRKLIHEKNGTVCQQPKKRSLDNLIYKYVGISRRDEPGIIQVAFNTSSLAEFEIKVGGFAVVAEEVYRLAEHSKESAKEISHLVKNIQKNVVDSVQIMHLSISQIDLGMDKAHNAGSALEEILKAAESVTQQAVEATQAAIEMEKSAGDLVRAVESVSAVVEENTAATEEMSAGSDQVVQLIENIASVSEENSAAVEQVSASTEEMSSQVEEVTSAAKTLAEEAKKLNDVISHFKLKSSDE